MWCDTFVDGMRIRPVGKSDVNVGVLEPETRINVRGNLVVGFDNIFDIYINKIIERVDVLLDKSLYFEKCGKK